MFAVRGSAGDVSVVDNLMVEGDGQKKKTGSVSGEGDRREEQMKSACGCVDTF